MVTFITSPPLARISVSCRRGSRYHQEKIQQQPPFRPVAACSGCHPEAPDAGLCHSPNLDHLLLGRLHVTMPFARPLHGPADWCRHNRRVDWSVLGPARDHAPGRGHVPDYGHCHARVLYPVHDPTLHVDLCVVVVTIAVSKSNIHASAQSGS